ncbi:MAG: aminopeptidase [Planctomycetaceae bacterium]|nr:aminopeptidase [Planctomycetaceae bacterium]
MPDSRLIKLADVLVNYSADVGAGDLVRLVGSPLSEPLLLELYRACLEIGAHPYIIMQPDACGELLFEYGTDLQIGYQSPIGQHEIETIDVTISLWGSSNTKALSRFGPDKLAKKSQARKTYMETFLSRSASGDLRWTGSQFPCAASAQDAEMSLRQYEDFVFKAGLLHLEDPVAAWKELSIQQQRLVDYLNVKHEIRFVTPQGTDLTLGVENRLWLNSDGKKNFPDGEVFTGPIESATEGTVCYSFPAVHGGRESDGIELNFENGRVVDAKASKGEQFLIDMLDQDEGARILGEIAIGTNYSITEYTKNTLFDEKIGGTFHAAVGASYPETGGHNDSGLHWDMVCDLRKGGQIFVDGELISENGKFLNAQWPQP